MRQQGLPVAGTALPRLPRPALHQRRWGVVALLLLGLAVLGQWAMGQARTAASTGLRAEDGGGRAIVADVRYGSLAWDAGVRPGDEVVALPGLPAEAWRDPARATSAADVVVGTASGQEVRVSVAAWSLWGRPDANAAVALLVAGPFVAVGAVVYVLAVDAAAALALLGITAAAAALSFGNLPAVYQTPTGGALANVGLRCFGGALLALFLLFPVDRVRRGPAGRRLLAVALIPTAVLAALEAALRLPGVSPGADALEWYEAASYAILAGQVIGAGLLALLALRGAGLGQARQAILLVALGTLVGFGPLVAVAVLPLALGGRPTEGTDWAVLATPVFPIALGAAVLSRQFFGITRLVRRGLVALLVWVALVGVATGVLRLLGGAAGVVVTGGPGVGALAAGVALVAAAFPPLQAGLRRGIERALFRDVYDYAGTLRRLSDEVAGLTGVGAIARHVLDRLGGTLDLSWAEIVLGDEADPLGYRWSADPTGAGEAPPKDARLRVPLVADGAVIGTLALGPKRRDVELLPEDRELVATLAPLVARALKGGLLLHRLEERVAELGERERELAALSGRLMRAQEEERHRLALDLHDDPLQRAILLEREVRAGPPSAQTARWREAIGEIVVSLRAIGTELRPAALDDLGLVAALDRLVNEARSRSDDVAVTLLVETADGAPFGRLRPELETALYRVAQEALNNCLKHAAADRIGVELRRGRDGVGMKVRDDGRGYGVAALPDTVGLGLLGMRERVRPWGGSVTIGAAGPEGGTVVSVAVPLGAGGG